jgi:8-oxo-dGTP pyrophosphatase MutT (NUDIX family)
MRRNPEQYWGRGGAGILFVCQDDNTVLLVLRSADVEQPFTWGIPGGSVRGEGMYSRRGASAPSISDSDFWRGAKTETVEECGSLPPNFSDADLVAQFDYVDGSFCYRNFVCNISSEDKRAWDIELNWENDEYAWVSADDLSSMGDLHFGSVFVLRKLGLLR